MAIQRFLVLSAGFGTMDDGKGKQTDYASLIVTGGKLPRIQRDDRAGVDASKMRCDIKLAQRLVKDNVLPCMGDVDFELDGPKGNPMAFDVIEQKGSKDIVLALFGDLFSKKFEVSTSNSPSLPDISVPNFSGVVALDKEEKSSSKSKP